MNQNPKKNLRNFDQVFGSCLKSSCPNKIRIAKGFPSQSINQAYPTFFYISFNTDILNSSLKEKTKVSPNHSLKSSKCQLNLNSYKRCIIHRQLKQWHQQYSKHISHYKLCQIFDHQQLSSFSLFSTHHPKKPEIMCICYCIPQSSHLYKNLCCYTYSYPQNIALPHFESTNLP